jgi:hypothetical protein
MNRRFFRLVIVGSHAKGAAWDPDHIWVWWLAGWVNRVDGDFGFRLFCWYYLRVILHE